MKQIPGKTSFKNLGVPVEPDLFSKNSGKYPRLLSVVSQGIEIAYSR